MSWLKLTKIEGGTKQKGNIVDSGYNEYLLLSCSG
jgi:hypothetical protein